jgi:ABC-type nitrate/sulfonate/bicarbonate transport system ATPase subunit
MPNEPDLAITFHEVAKSFTNRDGQKCQALKNFTVSAESGRVTCLLGPTGCGKTTALRILAGLEKCDSGYFSVNATRNADRSPALAYVSQQHTLLPWLRLEDNVAFPLRLRGVSKKERRRAAGAFLDKVGLAGKERLFPHECSGGMRQRAMLARLLATGAGLWLLDEPFANLDEKTRFVLEDTLLALIRENNISALFVTHGIEEAVYLADRIVIMSPSPGHVVANVEVPLPRQRDRLSSEFSALMETIRENLDSAILAG